MVVVDWYLLFPCQSFLNGAPPGYVSEANEAPSVPEHSHTTSPSMKCRIRGASCRSLCIQARENAGEVVVQPNMLSGVTNQDLSILGAENCSGVMKIGSRSMKRPDLESIPWDAEMLMVLDW